MGNYLKRKLSRNRVAVSELVGTLIMVAITLVAGAAAFGWVNGQAGVSENVYGQSAAAGSNYLREHFAPVTSTFGGTGAGGTCSGTLPNRVCTTASFWVFNNGQLAFTLSSLQIQSPKGSPNYLYIVYTATGFTAYSSPTGPTISCSPSTPGFSPTTTVPIGTLSSTPYSVTIPNCNGVNDIFVGQSYIITMTGLYGNVVSYQLTANG